MAYLAGLLFSDGCIYKSKNGAYGVWLDQVAGRGDQIIKKAKTELEKISSAIHYYTFNVNSTDENKFRILVYSKPIYQQLRDIKEDVVRYVAQLNDNDLASSEGFLMLKKLSPAD